MALHRIPCQVTPDPMSNSPSPTPAIFPPDNHHCDSDNRIPFHREPDNRMPSYRDSRSPSYGQRPLTYGTSHSTGDNPYVSRQTTQRNMTPNYTMLRGAVMDLDSYLNVLLLEPNIGYFTKGSNIPTFHKGDSIAMWYCCFVMHGSSHGVYIPPYDPIFDAFTNDKTDGAIHAVTMDQTRHACYLCKSTVHQASSCPELVQAVAQQLVLSEHPHVKSQILRTLCPDQTFPSRTSAHSHDTRHTLAASSSGPNHTAPTDSGHATPSGTQPNAMIAD
jgi:hypothetical protein